MGEDPGGRMSRIVGLLGAIVMSVLGGILGSPVQAGEISVADRKSTRLNSSHGYISYAVFCLKKKKNQVAEDRADEEREALHVRRPGPRHVLYAHNARAPLVTHLLTTLLPMLRPGTTPQILTH